jgi:peptidoglycan/LPS O-acetylase OafA/YrhL
MDGLRGIAAMAVMIDHYTHHSRIPGAWTVVDMFFILSGFVVCHSYRSKILQGMSFVAFMGTRLRRLLPLYWIGSLLGALGIWLTSLQRPTPGLDLPHMLRAMAEAMLLVPDFSAVWWPYGTNARQGLLFPLNPPAWTTFFQFFVNACFFGLLMRWRGVWRVSVCIAALLVLTALERYSGIYNPGWGQANFVWGFPRALFEFSLGVALYQAHARIPQVNFWLAALSTAVFLMLFNTSNFWLDSLNVIVMAPMAVVLAARTETPRALVKVFRKLGELSYPLYICHIPVWMLVLMLPKPDGMPGFLQTLQVCLVAMACAALLMRVDRAIRMRLTPSHPTTHRHTGA